MNATQKQHFEQVELVGGPACGDVIPVDVAFPRFRIKRGESWAVYEKEEMVPKIVRKARYIGWQTNTQPVKASI